MEEILASIRRIIADDDTAKPPKDAPLKASEPKASEPRLSEPLPLRPATLPPRMAPPRPEPAPMRPAAVTPVPAAPEPPVRQDALDSVLTQLQAAARPAPVEVDEPASDILDLTEQMAEPEPGPGFRTIDGQPDVVFDDSPPEPEPPPLPPPPRVVEPPRPRYDAGEAGLVSASTSTAVDSAFNTLAQTVLVQNGRTLEDLVREMLRPMLKTWLDDNLPGMVERLVRAEIERVSRGRG
jgi:cell pole-organizing protein PopZ